ncbi:hypothetical protein POPTR_013G010500v4 [Populus trichocarpa]|uniref:DUF4378 domain-containing protein n=1 Tax=Populus trichocarpa TaxID=3694 RepID=A0A3N7HJX1_POPTR|nr:uncharacterized protein LOC7481704 isoform X3 [Populus trichocarpa]RQO98804.1 hypothetical protein POPTR_013G010500v4 [Populus trichocarpa]|eukprot:XP_024439891.1 uncharacterized protein LOC7481704 isoform X3 [Populus trichocarpa]
MSDNRMEVERKRTKGGFFHLFDWNGKSRKKLFVNNYEFPEGLKQGKENVEKMAKPRLHMTELDDRRANSSNRGSSEFSCALSVTSDEGYGTRAPGAVARLMGLDSLPASNVAEPSSTLGFDPHSLRAFPCDRSTPNLWSEYNPMDYRNIPNEQEKYAWNSVESRLQKVENRPIARFQTEALAPKLAKSIPVTHHKLLSPIKNPGFTPTKNVAYIMEAAAKIIEASPKASSIGKMPSIRTSSVPLRIRDLKQKMEAAHLTSRPQRSNEPSVARNTKEQQSDKRRSGSEGLSSAKASTGSGKGTPNSLRNKGKSVPIAAQAKSNAQKRDGSPLRSKSIVKQKEQNEVKANQLLKNQHCTQKAIQKRTFESRTNNVLQQNNLKQNSVPNKGSSTLKNSVSNQQGNKTQSTSGSVGQYRNVNKIVVKPEIMPRKIGSVMMDSEKEKKKKQSVSGDLQIDRSVSPNVSFNKDGRSTKSNAVIDGNKNMAMDNRKNGMDVVSFMFSSPIKRAMPSYQSSGQMSDKCNNSAIDSFGSNDHPSFRSSTSYLPGLNVVGGDVMGVFLEQKLRELTNKVESTHCNGIREETSATSSSSLENSLSTPNVASTPSARLDQMLQIVHDKDKSDSLGYFDCVLVEKSQLAMNQKWQQSEEMEVQSSSSNYSETGKELECQRTSPVSILEPSFASGSCSYLNGSSHCSTNESVEMEGETELSDSASSISIVDVVRKYTTRTCSTTELKELSDWELDFIRDILNSAELNLKGFALGQTFKVINPNLFDLLENQDKGSCKAWAKLSTLFQRKGWLAEELYKEILGWQSMGDLMVDELVEQDMSTPNGKWLDFSIEAFEDGVEIEDGILTSLVDELVSDLLPL